MVRGQLLPDRVVDVVDGRIVGIAPSEAPHPRSPALRVIDGEEGFLIPGLWDMHGHPLPTGDRRPEAWWEPDPETSFALLVANGVTGVRDMWGSLEIAARIERERRTRNRNWPRLLSPGAIVDGPIPYYPGLVAVGSADEARAVVDSLRAGGADFVKVYSSLPEDLFLDIVERSREVGLDVAGHVPAAVRARTASEAGMRSFEHLYSVLEGCSTDEDRLLADNVAFLDARVAGRSSTRDDRAWFERLLETQDDARCRLLLRGFARRSTWQVPTLVALSGVFRLRDPEAAADPRLAYVDPRVRAFWGLASYDETRSFGDTDWVLRQRRFERLKAVVRMMAEEGTPLLAGSDFHPTVAFTYPGFSLHDELEQLVDAGLSELDALRTATLNPARYFGATDSLGSVQPGKLADLVLLGANPLADIRNTRSIRAVSLAGRWLPGDSLEALLAGVAARNREPEPVDLPALPPGADRTVELAGIRGGIRLVFLLDPEVVADDLPGFLQPIRAVALAGSSAAADAFLVTNPQFRDWFVSGLELLLADSVRIDGGRPRRSAEAQWWIATATDSAFGPSDLPGYAPTDEFATRILLASWGAGTGDGARLSGREFDSGTWSFSLEDLSLRLDLVCTPGGARSRVDFIDPPTRVSWQGDPTPEWYLVSSRAGELGRDCDLRVSAEGLHPLATGLKRAPLLRGPGLGARIVEFGRARTALYRVD